MVLRVDIQPVFEVRGTQLACLRKHMYYDQSCFLDTSTRISLQHRIISIAAERVTHECA